MHNPTLSLGSLEILQAIKALRRGTLTETAMAQHAFQ
jgi:hypothetical protein